MGEKIDFSTFLMKACHEELLSREVAAASLMSV